jgi:alkanesulfonate monooxygenase SsuD/methylene tetrahydromethanopterin reductase-like flavin-dependent oxidoreductase (luciferase family)
MDEMLEIIRRFWTQESVEFHGEFFDFAACGIAPAPARPVPIWVGGKSDAALSRAVRQDGWLGMNYDLPEIFDLLDSLQARLEAHRAHTGESKDEFEIFVIPNAEPSEDLYRDLSGRGVTATMGMAWGYADPAFASLEAKAGAIEAFAERFLAA